MTDKLNTEELQNLRSDLRLIDDQIMQLLKQRMTIAMAIGKQKALLGIEILDTAREALNREHNRKFSDACLPTAMTDEVTDLLASWSRNIQNKI
jgi:chorismate mutase